MTGVNLQQTFKYKYTLKQICHCEEQRDDAIWSVLTRLLHYVRNDTFGKRKIETGNTKMVLIATHHGRLPRSPKGKLAMTDVKPQQTIKYKNEHVIKRSLRRGDLLSS